MYLHEEATTARVMKCICVRLINWSQNYVEAFTYAILASLSLRETATKHQATPRLNSNYLGLVCFGYRIRDSLFYWSLRFGPERQVHNVQYTIAGTTVADYLKGQRGRLIYTVGAFSGHVCVVATCECDSITSEGRG